MSADLAAWLLEQIAEDEGAALAAAEAKTPPWSSDRPGLRWQAVPSDNNDPVDGPHFVGGAGVGDGDVWDTSENSDSSVEVARHLANWDPARVLAECEAKRRIVVDHRPDHAREWPCCARCHTGMSHELETAGWPCQTVRLLALPYASRDGYREEWAPEPRSS